MSPHLRKLVNIDIGGQFIRGAEQTEIPLKITYVYTSCWKGFQSIVMNLWETHVPSSLQNPLKIDWWISPSSSAIYPTFEHGTCRLSLRNGEKTVLIKAQRPSLVPFIGKVDGSAAREVDLNASWSAPLRGADKGEPFKPGYCMILLIHLPCGKWTQLWKTQCEDHFSREGKPWAFCYVALLKGDIKPIHRVSGWQWVRVNSARQADAPRMSLLGTSFEQGQCDGACTWRITWQLVRSCK